MAQPLTDAINALTRYANETTGQSDQTLSDAVETLVEGYGQGGGTIYKFAYTPITTTREFVIDVDDFVLGNSYVMIFDSANNVNDPDYETVVRGGIVHMAVDNTFIGGTEAGRVITNKKGSGTDWWNSVFWRISQSGTSLTFKGNVTYSYLKQGIEYHFTLFNFPDDILPLPR